MNKYKNLLNSIKEENPPIIESSNIHDRVLIIDGLNLFFRNFSVLNMVNPNGVHVGGLGGFLRSLGFLIKILNPTSVYVIFDGEGSSQNRKNILPEYKLGRGSQRLTKYSIFDNLEEEDESKIQQIVRIIQYLKLLPIKLMLLDKVEADDIISVLSTELPRKYNSDIFIVSSDKDFLQLINEKCFVFRPIEKEIYDKNKILKKYNVLAENFIIYKSLLGDASDKIPGVKGLGDKKIFKLFPELKYSKVTLEDLFKICEKKYKEHIIYARILQDKNKIRNTFKIMNLHKPFVSEDEKYYLNKIIEGEIPNFEKKEFINLYEQDELGGIIRNLNVWLEENFQPLTSYKNNDS